MIKIQKSFSVLKQFFYLNRNISFCFTSSEKKPASQEFQNKPISNPKKKSFLKADDEDKNKFIIPHKNSVSNETLTMVFARYLPLDWNEQDIRKHFDPTNVNIKKIVLVKNRLGVYSGKALVEFVSREICERFVNKWHENFIETAENFRRIIFKPLHLKINSQKPQIQGGLKQVYIYNIEKTATPDDIYSLASDFGEITQVQFPIHEGTKKHKGYGFINFKKPEFAQKFLEFADGKEFFGRTLRVQIKNFKFDTQKKQRNSYSNLVIDSRNPNKNDLQNANMKENLKVYEELLSKDEIN